MSWPWLSDAKAGTNQVTLPEDKRYGRPVVAELIVEHAKSIAELRSTIQDDPLYEPTKHDDLWLLRFLLSHKGKVQKAATACKHTLLFRRTHQLDLADVRFQPPSKTHPSTKSFLAYGDDSVLGVDLPDPTRAVVTYIHLSGLDQHGLIANVADEGVESYFIHLTEWSHQVCCWEYPYSTLLDSRERCLCFVWFDVGKQLVTQVYFSETAVAGLRD
jgi:hypothetical protein